MKRKNVGKGSVVRYRTYSTCLQHNVPISGTGLRGPVPRASLKAIFVSISIYILISISQVSNNSQVAN
jgi:hypothetical protein